MIGQSSQHQQSGDAADRVADDGHRDAEVSEPFLRPVDVAQGIGAAAAAKEATRETTADKNANRSVPPWRASLIAGATFCIEPCISVPRN